MSDIEKHEEQIYTRDARSSDQNEGYLVDATRLDSNEGLKTSSDGRHILIPQPTEDPNDPVNWSKVRKHIVLFIIAYTAFLPDYGSATGAVTLLPQAK